MDHHELIELFLSFSLESALSSGEILDIPISDRDRDMLMAIGKIKRQKQRPSVERLYNILQKMNHEFNTREKIQDRLDDLIHRKLLTRIQIPGTGLISYREINSAIPIVAINHPTRSRAHLVDELDPSAVSHPLSVHKLNNFQSSSSKCKFFIGILY